MNNSKNHIKILSALSIAASDTREDTLISIIIRTLFVKGKISSKNFTKSIQEEFDFEPYDPEIHPIIERLKDEGKINISGGNITLADEEIERVKKQGININDEDKERFQNFKSFIVDTLEESLDIKKVKFLWLFFQEYLFNSFYEYGYDALKTLHPHIDNGKAGNGKYEDLMQKALTRIRDQDDTLGDIFKKIVEQFPDFASVKDLDFLNDLAQKTLSFTSLGLRPELAFDTIDHNIVDWVLYLDTNILYSLLNLHSHPENQACHALIKLIQTNNEYIQIKLRYSEQTYKELGSKKADFSLLDDKMTDSAVRALLNSNRLDDFSKKFYQDLLENRESTIHPSKVIEFSQRTLKQEVIEIGRTGKRLEHLGEEYIEQRMDDYAKFILDKNNVKQAFCEEKKIMFHPHFRSKKQLWHDISLREILIDSRTNKPKQDLTLNNIKFFGLTLDNLLISFDRSQVKNYTDSSDFPIFFKPSFLLNKLIKILPIKTVDYKKAFIKAITTKGYHKNTNKSEDILKIVNYLKSKGIDDEKVIYSLITEDIFLDKFRENSGKNDFEVNEFIESELNREFKERLKELEETKKELAKSEDKSTEFEIENKALDTRKVTLESDLKLYKSALDKVTDKVKKLETTTVSDKQIDINFEAGEERKRASKAEEKAKSYKTNLIASLTSQIDTIRNDNLKKWQKKIWWNLFWVIPLITLGFFLVIPNDILHIEIPTMDGEHDNTLSIVLGVIAFICNFFFFKLLYDRYFNELSKKSRKENTVIPQYLKQKLDELNL